LARRATLPAIAGQRKFIPASKITGYQPDPRREERYGQPPRVARTESKTKKAPMVDRGFSYFS
jgi:hypothetical protein